MTVTEIEQQQETVEQIIAKGSSTVEKIFLGAGIRGLWEIALQLAKINEKCEK